MARQSVVVMDCGSTTTRVVAVDQAGKLLAQASAPSGPSPQKGGQKGWLKSGAFFLQRSGGEV